MSAELSSGIDTRAIARFRNRRRTDVERATRVVLGAVLILACIGVVMVASTSTPSVAQPGGTWGKSPLARQLMWCLLAGVAMVVACDIDYRLLRRWAFPLLGLTVLLLGLVLIPGIGTKVKGARRWIRVGPIGLQPSELAKLTLVVFCSAYLVRRGPRMGDFVRGALPALAVVGVVCGLVVIEPDFGTALFLGGISLLVLISGGLRPRHIMPLVLIALPVLVHLVVHRFDHVQTRISVFLDPAADPRGKGHQILQSLIALGSGGYTGRGLGLGRQKLHFLPEAENDFVFAAIGEELGMLGCVLVIALFCGFLWYGAKIALCAPDDFGGYLALGIVLVISCQAAANIAVVTASVPTKGISLPFVSLGGSSLLIFSSMVGILLNIGRQAMGLELMGDEIADSLELEGAMA